MSKLKYNYLPELRAFLAGRPKPSMVTVNLTERCNQRCIYCEIGQGIPSDASAALTTADMSWILDEMSSPGLKISRISLCGGEPFLFTGLMDVISYATAKKIRCSITSNGMTLHRLGEADFEILRENKADINLSIDSFDEGVQSLTRGTPSALANALLSFERLRAERIPVTVLAAISRHNFRNLSSYIESAHRIGIRQVLFQPIIHYTNYPDRPSIGDKAALNVPPGEVPELMEELGKISRFEKKHDISTNVYRILPWINHYLESTSHVNGKMFFQEVLGEFYCREIDATIDIAYDGGIQPCGLTRATVNIHDRQGRGLLQLWREATRQIRDDISQHKFYEYCNACCHKFSRNMMASVVKHPWKNRKALGMLAPLVLSRLISKSKKKLSVVK